nr:hypothetical protein [Pandoravirus massiliensis]
MSDDVATCPLLFFLRHHFFVCTTIRAYLCPGSVLSFFFSTKESARCRLVSAWPFFGVVATVPHCALHIFLHCCRKTHPVAPTATFRNPIAKQKLLSCFNLR